MKNSIFYFIFQILIIFNPNYAFSSSKTEKCSDEFVRIGEYSFVKDVAKYVTQIQVKGNTAFTSIVMYFDGKCASLIIPLNRNSEKTYLMNQVRLYRSPGSKMFQRGRTEPMRPDPEGGVP